MTAKVMVRKLRHWKQQFDKNAAFVFTRPRKYANKAYGPGDEIPNHLFENKAKLKRFWESKVIELAEFERPNVATGRPQEPAKAELFPDLPEGMTVEKPGKANKYIVSVEGVDPVRITGKGNLNVYIAEYREFLASKDDEKDNSEAETTEASEDAPDEAGEADEVDPDALDDDGWLDGNDDSNEGAE